MYIYKYGGFFRLIKNKTESDRVILERGLNRLSSEVFSQGEVERLKKYLNETDFEYYNIREKKASSGSFKYKLTKEQVIQESKDFQIFSVHESLAGVDDKLILQGEIYIDADWVMVASLSTVKNIPNREAMKKPEYTIEVDLKSCREPNIDGLTEVIDYIVGKELIGMVVEFSLFDARVGVNNENIIIWELRNY